MSVCGMADKIALVGVLFVCTLLQQVNYCLPFVLMSVLGFAASFVGLALPETKDKPTRERFEDIFLDKRISSQAGIENSGVVNGDDDT